MDFPNPSFPRSLTSYSKILLVLECSEFRNVYEFTDLTLCRAQQKSIFRLKHFLLKKRSAINIDIENMGVVSKSCEPRIRSKDSEMTTILDLEKN